MKASEAMNELVKELREQFPHQKINDQTAALIQMGFLAGQRFQMDKQEQKV